MLPERPSGLPERKPWEPPEESIKGVGDLSPRTRKEYLRKFPLIKSPEENAALWREMVALELQERDMTRLRQKIADQEETIKRLENNLKKFEEDYDGLVAQITELNKRIFDLTNKRLSPGEDSRTIVPNVLQGNNPPEIPTFKRESVSKPTQSWFKRTIQRAAQGVGAILVIFSSMTGSGAPISSPLKEDKPSQALKFVPILTYVTPTPTPARETIVWQSMPIPLPTETPEPTRIPTKTLEPVRTPVPVETLEKPPRPTPLPTEQPTIEVPVVAETPSLITEVVVEKGSWFWSAAKDPVESWLQSKGIFNWKDDQSGLELSDMIIKVLVERLRKEGVDFQRLWPGQRFTFDLHEIEEVVKISQTRSYEEYSQLFGGQK